MQHDNPSELTFNATVRLLALSVLTVSLRAGVIGRCGQAVLELEQQPPDEALMAAAKAAVATPDASANAQHQSDIKDAAAAKADRRQRERQEGGARDGSKRREDKRGNKRDEPTARFPRSDNPVVQHKLRLLRSAPYVELRAGDWFCGECGAHNYAFKQVCFRSVRGTPLVWLLIVLCASGAPCLRVLECGVVLCLWKGAVFKCICLLLLTPDCHAPHACALTCMYLLSVPLTPHFTHSLTHTFIGVRCPATALVSARSQPTTCARFSR